MTNYSCLMFRDQFKSTDERDAYLRKEIRGHKRLIDEIEEIISNLERSQEEGQQGIDELNKQIRVRTRSVIIINFV